MNAYNSFEVDNSTRSDWAEKALAAFTMAVFNNRMPSDLAEEDRQDAVQDLISNLLHYAKQEGFDVDGILFSAENNFKEECEEENEFGSCE